MYQRKLLVVLLILMVGAFFIGCPTNQATTLKPLSEMTPKEKATWMYSVYNSQYKDYENQAAMGDQLTDASKKILVEKKKVLIKIWPMLKMYDGYIQTGAIPDREVEENIVNMLNQLLTL